jgi:alpha-tubulin suppressor-like RCC1 family protein
VADVVGEVGGRVPWGSRSDHKAFAWGNNGNGALGDATTTRRSSPVQVLGLTTVQQISGGAGFTLAIAT